MVDQRHLVSLQNKTSAIDSGAQVDIDSDDRVNTGGAERCYIVVIGV